MYFLYYVLPNYGVNMSAMQAGILGIGLHYACYLAEVYRGAWTPCRAASGRRWWR